MVKGGFTLMEIMVVLLVLAVAAAVVSLRVQGPMAQATSADVVSRLAAMDALARQYASQQDKAVQISFDLAGRRVRCSEAAQEGDGQPVGPAVSLPKGHSIQAVWTAQGQTASGTVTVGFSPEGLTQTYAIVLKTPAGRQWLLFSGLCGQTLVSKDEKEIREIFSALAGSSGEGAAAAGHASAKFLAARPDAH